jgi:DNA-binding transcriptional MocR family regulator
MVDLTWAGMAEVRPRAMGGLDAVQSAGSPDTVMAPAPHREVPVGRRKRAHDIAEKLEAMIAADEFEVGSRLPSEKELMARFGVGRPAVREALFMLQQQGRIEIASGTRARVISPTPAILVQQLGALIKRVADGPRGQEYGRRPRTPATRTSSGCARRWMRTSPHSAGSASSSAPMWRFTTSWRGSRAIRSSTSCTRSWSSG